MALNLKVSKEILNRKIGFVGCGQMGKALLSSFNQLLRDITKESQSSVQKKFYLYDPSQNIKKFLSAEGYENIVSHESEVFQETDIIFNCVKPHIISNSIINTRNKTNKDKMMISIAAGINLNYMEQIYRLEAIKAKEEIMIPKIVRVMTNHLVALKQGSSVYSMNSLCNSVDEEIISFLFNKVGLIHKIDETNMHAFTGLSGSGPAFVYYFIESMVDSALKNGIDVVTARQHAVQTVMGAAMFMDSQDDKTPNNAKYIVSTPKGTTIHGLHALNEHRFKFTVDAAISAAIKRSEEIEIEKNNELEKLIEAVKKLNKL